MSICVSKEIVTVDPLHGRMRVGLRIIMLFLGRVAHEIGRVQLDRMLVFSVVHKYTLCGEATLRFMKDPKKTPWRDAVNGTGGEVARDVNRLGEEGGLLEWLPTAFTVTEAQIDWTHRREIAALLFFNNKFQKLIRILLHELPRVPKEASLSPLVIRWMRESILVFKVLTFVNFAALVRT